MFPLRPAPYTVRLSLIPSNPIMFNNIIYFIVVLAVFFINSPDTSQKYSFLYFLSMLFITWAIFTAYCRWGVRDIQKQFQNRKNNEGYISAQYHRLIARLSVLAIFLFVMDVFILNLKGWIQKIPGIEPFSVLQGMAALLLFFFYLSTLWFVAHPAYRSIFRYEITRRSFIESNLRFNLPFLFPWMCLSLIFDLLALSPWGGRSGLPMGEMGSLFFFGSLVILIMIYMPGVIQYWWGCRPVKVSKKAGELIAFLREKEFKYRALLSWPIFEGRMMTAGIMGVVARFRYILITDSLMEILSLEELKSVLAHEMGHAKYRHLLFYILFLMGLIVIVSGLESWLHYIFLLHPSLMEIAAGRDPITINLYNLIQFTPVILIVVVYFRYVMGFFMRNFERQADLYSAQLMGSPAPAVNSLEKIGLLSGKTRNLPSWHHFSIRQRVDCLMQSQDRPDTLKRHNRFIARCLLVYLVSMVGLGYALNSVPLKKYMIYSMIEKAIEERLLEEPDSISLYLELATVYHETGALDKAMETYEKILVLDPDHAPSLNNLAWILVTAPDENLRDPERALKLAKQAVALDRAAHCLDTLAEAYYMNRYVDEALVVIKEAILVAKEKREYYEMQQEKFLKK